MWSEAQLRYFNRGIGPHGTRARYTHGDCRCVACKKANAAYNVEYRRRKPHLNAMISARHSRRHLLKLGRNSVGLRSVSDVTGMSFTNLKDIRSGRILRVQTKTERRILRVTKDAHADQAVISGAKTLRMVTKLQREGFGYEQLALKLEMCPETLERLVRRKGNVRAKTQMKVEKFYNRVMAA